jgi:hypothetical protein
MYIHDDHRHYGSAIIQVAEHPHFTAINACQLNGHASRCGFRVNKSTGLYLRYSSKPKGKSAPVYKFTLSRENLDELSDMRKRFPSLYLALICVKARQICCLPYSELLRLIEDRKQCKGEVESQYVVEVMVRPAQQFRVGISCPNEKGKWFGPLVIPRNDFPGRLFLVSTF